MTDDPSFDEDYQLQGLVRDYERRKDGWNGLVGRIDIFREAHKYLEPERFDRFCERVHLRKRIEKDLMHHFVRRLEKIESILGSLEVESFSTSHLLMISRSEFETAIELAGGCSGPDAQSLFQIIVDALVFHRMQPGDPDEDICAMTWKTKKPPSNLQS